MSLQSLLITGTPGLLLFNGGLMATYINKSSDVLLPFIQKVPFPIGCISNISVCIANGNTAYVTSISSA